MFNAMRKRTEELKAQAAQTRARTEVMRAETEAKLAKVEQVREEIAQMKEEAEALRLTADRCFQRAETARQELLEKLERAPASVRKPLLELARRINLPLEEPIARPNAPRR